MIKFIWPIDIIYLNKIDSTNKFARRYFNNFFYKNEKWIIIRSDNQTDGIGISGTWVSEYKKNLTFSIFFNPKNIYVYDGFILNIITSNAIHKVLSKKINNIVYIKWPNDIIINNKKVGGILIENRISFKKINSTIIGIGINIKQNKFNPNWNASSLNMILNINFELDLIFFEIIFFIQKEYFNYLNNKHIQKYFIENLYLKNKIFKFFSYKHNYILSGVIKSVTNKGFLLVESNSKKYLFWQKDIKFL
ncbi:biotin--[acetyl-CoA-carboxylase] ligase [Blattabacterium cuenoti]|uniref:biotin--[acetyl-CoA-carboxylase] ligase n=1 Tax=Blattabacterium cuenoti TaxID=1653831 RepID=UPI00163C544B|nr:biotin--[acetyl-CoA-carboxylase] ligase [Blattabacterium cuenoti]